MSDIDRQLQAMRNTLQREMGALSLLDAAILLNERVKVLEAKVSELEAKVKEHHNEHLEGNGGSGAGHYGGGPWG